MFVGFQFVVFSFNNVSTVLTLRKKRVTFFDDPTQIISQLISSVLFSRFSSQYASTPMVFIIPILGISSSVVLLSHMDNPELRRSVIAATVSPIRTFFFEGRGRFVVNTKKCANLLTDLSVNVL